MSRTEVHAFTIFGKSLTDKDREIEERIINGTRYRLHNIVFKRIDSFLKTLHLPKRCIENISWVNGFLTPNNAKRFKCELYRYEYRITLEYLPVPHKAYQ